MNFPQCTYFPLEEKASLLSQHFKVILKLNRSAASNSTGLNPYLIFNCVCISINHKEAILCLNSDSQLSLNCLAQLSYALVGSREYYTTSYGTLAGGWWTMCYYCSLFLYHIMSRTLGSQHQLKEIKFTNINRC